MQLVVKLAPANVQVNPRDVDQKFTPALTGVLAALALDLQPMHPGSSDPELSSFFYVELSDQDVAANAISLLLQTNGVQSAYLKPRDEMP